MKVVVLLKKVPDLESDFVLSDKGDIDYSALKFIINPYDEIAVEEALRIKDKGGASVETIVVCCDEHYESNDIVLKALALGIDRAVIIKTKATNDLSGRSTARLLAEELKKIEPDLIFCGKNSSDSNNSQVPAMLSELLDLPFVHAITKFRLLDDGSCIVEKPLNESTNEYKINLPAILSVDKTLNTPRYANLMGIMKAKQKPVEVVDGGTHVIPSGQRSVSAVKYHRPNQKPPINFIDEGSTTQNAKTLIKILQEKSLIQ